MNPRVSFQIAASRGAAKTTAMAMPAIAASAVRRRIDLMRVDMGVFAVLVMMDFKWIRWQAAVGVGHRAMKLRRV
jgi:hypothetical protein